MKSFEDFLPRDRNQHWVAAHVSATALPHPGHERAIRDMLMGVQGYVNAQHLEWDSAVDSVLSIGVGHIIEGLRRLLDGPTGRFDAGTIMRFLEYLANDVGWCTDHEQLYFDCSDSCNLAQEWRASRLD